MTHLPPIAWRAPFPEVAHELRELLGARLAAYIGGVAETRAVREWAEGARTPGNAVQQRFRVALQVALLLNESDGREVTNWAIFEPNEPHVIESAAEIDPDDPDLRATLDAYDLVLQGG